MFFPTFLVIEKLRKTSENFYNVAFKLNSKH